MERIPPGFLEVIGFDNYGTGPGPRVSAGQIVARFMLRGPTVRGADSRADPAAF
ncbi:hypothetical protein [Streptomyces sp. GS7]|uniref:hypothetical protein n=1 Tax=Streptomyces sp. GS7 TaxID=2692234 RepID=UPI001F236C22|nr:hypothetical protein [Streptomyces sp. GS7]